MHNKSQKKQTFWKQIRFKYKLSILNENTLEEVFSFRLSGLYIFLVVGLFSFLLITLTSVIIITTPIRNYLPGYLSSEIRNEMILQALKADSLEVALNSRNVYLTNLASILRGEMSVDSIQNSEPIPISPDSVDLDRSPLTNDFVKRYEEESKYNLSSLPSTTNRMDMAFYRPVRGIVSSPFSRVEKHFGIDVAADSKESILATLDGTVIYAGFDANVGYVIHLQHKNGYTSIYKHNAILLKRQGDKVKAGEAIALVGNTGRLSTGTHLHFELWYKGEAVNPEDYIIFR